MLDVNPTEVITPNLNVNVKSPRIILQEILHEISEDEKIRQDSYLKVKPYERPSKIIVGENMKLKPENKI